MNPNRYFYFRKMILKLGLLGLAMTFAPPVFATSESEKTEISTTGTVYTESNWIDEQLEEAVLEKLPMWNTLGNYYGKSEPGSFTGRIEVGPIVLKNKLRLYLGGPIRDPKIHLKLHNPNTKEDIELGTRFKIGGVSLHQWTIPKAWRNIPILLIADDQSPRHDGWIGISAPLSKVPAQPYFTQSLKLLYLLLNLIVPFCLYMALGLTGYALLVRLWPQAKSYMVILVLTIPLLLGYLQFYVAIKSLYISYLLGTLALIASATFILMGGIRKKDFSDSDLHYFLPVFFLVLLSVLMVSSTLYMDWTQQNSLRFSQERLLSDSLPLDNYLPLLTLDRLYGQESLKPFITEWRSTDRPPLQAAANLLVRPFFIDSVEGYQAFSCWLQVSILFGVQFLLQCLGIARRRALIICGLVLFSGTYLANTLFVWPKMYAILFPLFLTGLLLRKAAFEKDLGFWIIAGSVSSCAMLIHPGSLFALLAILLVYTGWHRKLSWQQFAAIFIVFMIWMLPWLMYQKTYDPPGNANLKRFFANYPNFEDEVGFMEAMKIGYGELTLKNWALGRWDNIKTLVGYFPIAYNLFFDQLPSGSQQIRNHSFTFIGISLGPMVLGYLLALFSWKQMDPPLKSAIKYSFYVILTGLLIWVILILPRARTIIHHGSYYFPVLMMILGGLLVQNRPRLLIALFAIQLVYFQLVWATPAFRSEMNNGLLLNINFVNPAAITLYIFSVLMTLGLILKGPKNERTLGNPDQT